MENLSCLRDRICRAWGNLRLVRGTPAFVLILLSSLYDWSEKSDASRDGKTRALLIAASFLAFGALKRRVGAVLAAFFSYACFMWVMRDYHWNGTMHLLNMLAAALVASWLTRHESTTFWLSVVGMLQAGFGLVEASGVNVWAYMGAWHGQPTGLFNQETILGVFLVACLPAALFYRRWWASVPILACIVATKSSTTWAGAGAIVALWAYQEFGWRVPVAMAIAAALAAARLPHDHELFNFNGRTIFWRYAVEEYVLKRPLFGYGSGFWYPQAPLIKIPQLDEPQHLTHLHNEFLEGLVEYGVVGMGILLTGLVGFFRRFRITWHHATVVGLLVVAGGNFVFHIAPIGVIFLTAWLLSVRPKLTVIQ